MEEHPFAFIYFVSFQLVGAYLVCVPASLYDTVTLLRFNLHLDSLRKLLCCDVGDEFTFCDCALQFH